MSLLRVPARALQHTVRRRSLVSTVLLTKQWNESTVADLRKEAKARGLPANGGKASLITRIQQHDNAATLAALAPEPTVPQQPAAAVIQHVRHAHVLHPPTATAETAAPASPATAPGVPPADTPKYDKQYLDVKIPNLSVPDPEVPVQIPFGPDYWHSKTPASGDPTPKAAPQLLVVAGGAAHPGTASTVHDVIAHSSGSSSSSSSSSSSHDHSRALSDEERKGAWTLGGIIVGSFLLSGFFDAGSAVEKASLKAKELKHKAEAEASHAKAKAGEKMDEVKTKAGDKVDEVKTKAGEVKDKAVKKVDEAKGAVSAKGR